MGAADAGGAQEQAFSGIRVFDATQGVAGPHASMLLALHGADVVKVEPLAGDWGRAIGQTYGDHSAHSIAFNRAKRSIALDLKSDAGRDVARRLAGEADVVVELTFTTPVAAHCCMETHGSVAQWEGDQVTVWHSTQSVFGTRSSVAEILDIPQQNVRAICEYVGGGFGSKWGAESYTLMALLAAKERSTAVQRGIAWLIDNQREDGGLDEAQYTGTGFPGDFYINYHIYRDVFPLTALGRYASEKT